jgi:hydroxymethylbilane synthase
MRTGRIVSKLNHPATQACIAAERAFLRKLEGGCQVPIGAHATIDGDIVTLEGMVGSLDGTVIFRERISGSVGDTESLGTNLGDSLIRLGARELLESTRETASNSQVTM